MACGCKKFHFLFVAFSAVVRLAEHLAIGDVGLATFRPGGYMVSIHLG